MRPAAQSSAGYRIRYVASHAGRSDLTSVCAAHPTPVSLCSPVASLALSLIEGNTFAYAIYRLATLPSPGGLDPGPWEGTAGELLDTLRRICTDARMTASDLPDDVRAVGRQVREIAPSLRKAGIDIRPRKSGPRRLLRITKIENEEAGPKEQETPLSLARISAPVLWPLGQANSKRSWRPSHQGTVVSAGRLAWRRTGE